MLFYVGKSVQFLAAPLHWVVVLLVVGILLLSRRPVLGRRLVIFATLLLYVASNPVVSYGLLAGVERQYPIVPSKDLPSADAIVVLGGTVYSLESPRVEAEEMTGARVLRAARLYKEGKASIIVCAGGVPYPASDGSTRIESDDMHDVLVAMGVPTDAILKEKASRNTFENAQGTAELLQERGVKTILLATSAFHMPRASALFRKQGFDVVAASSDPRATGSPWKWRSLLPSPEALRSTTLATYEYIGFVGYRLLGKL
jgi:uncharacterized SAM-binding protein YcdF (DUF218 family)